VEPMLGPMGTRIIDMLKIITPGEIDKYMDKPNSGEISHNIKKAAGAEDFDVTKAPQQVPQPSHKNKKEEDQSEELEHQAKIIPINKESSEHLDAKSEEERAKKLQQEQQEKQESSDEVDYVGTKGESELESAGIYSASKIEALKRKKLKELKAKQESTTSFILNQRDKLKKTKLKLIEMDAIKNYNNNSNVESLNDEIDIDNPEEEASIGTKGILVNKKHF
jgi:hypothetical protein